MKEGINRTLLYEQVVAELYKLIDQERIKPGNRFPSERELVQQWDISRNVLREAFHVLEERGIIISRQGKGRYLRILPEREYSHKYESLSKNLERYSLLEIYETRLALEVKVVEQVVKNALDSDIDELYDFYRKLSTRFYETNSTAGEFDMHRLYANKCKNSFLEQLVDLTFKTVLDMMTSSFRDVFADHTAAESIKAHGEILDAIRSRDVERAKDAMSRHIENTIKMLV